MAESKIIVRILGGLGNQMFQYALGRQLSIIHNRELKLDLGFYEILQNKWAVRIFGLNNFNVDYQSATNTDVAMFKKYLQNNLFSKTLRQLKSFGRYYKRNYIREPIGKNFYFEPKLLTTKFKNTVYLDGFWQSEKYFIQIGDTIRKDFTFLNPPDEKNAKVLEKILKTESVAIHIRHGDNATKMAKHHGVLPIKYYENSVFELTKIVSKPVFYVFSDDPIWAKENLKLKQPAVFLDHNKEDKNYEDLRLMINCKHHIIGNSTFSWWGAWLGKKIGQKVFAPGRYHMNADIPMADYYPKVWRVINF